MNLPQQFRARIWQHRSSVLPFPDYCYIVHSRLLIIDEDRSLAEPLRTVLHRAFDVAMASNAEAGLRLAIQFQPEVILCDTTLAQQLAGPLNNEPLTADIPVVLMFRGDTPPPSQDAAGCVQKPLDVAQVERILAHLVASAGVGAC